MWSLVAVATLARARPPTPSLSYQPTDYQMPLLDVCFGSGLRVIAQRDDTRPLVAIRTLHPGGWSDDPPGKAGVAHMAEHLWFRARRDHAEVRQHHLRLGAKANAQTQSTWTAFDVEGPSDALGTLLQLEGTRMTLGLPGIDEATVDAERGVLENERIQKHRDDEVPHLMRALLPPDDPLAQLDESPASVARIHLEDLRGHAQQHWGPTGTTLLIVGDVELDGLEALLKAHLPKAILKGQPSGPLEHHCDRAEPAQALAPPHPRIRGVQEVPWGIQAPALQIGWTVPAPMPESYYDLTFLADLFQDVINVELEDRRISAGASCTLRPRASFSLLSCAIVMDPQVSPRRVLRLVRRRLWLMRSQPVSPDAYLRERTAVEQRRLEGILGNASLIHRAQILSRHVQATDSITPTHDRMIWLAQADSESIVALMKAYLSRRRMAAVILEPNDEGRPGWSEAHALTPRPGERPAAPELDAALLEAWVAPPDPAKVARTRLPNGLEIVAVRVEGGPMIRSGLLLRGGEWVAPQPGLAWLTWFSTRNFNDRTSEAPHRFLGEWSDDMDELGPTISLSGASGNLDGELYLLRDMLDRTVVDPADRRALVRWVAWAERHDRWEPHEALRRRVASIIYPALLAGPSPTKTLKQIRPAEIRAWHEQVWQPANATLLMVGHLEPLDALDQAEAWFEDWASTGQPLPPPPPPPKHTATQQQGLLGVEDPDAVLARVELYCPVPGGWEAQLLRSALESRSWERLRYEHGISYGVDSTLKNAGTHALLRLSTETDPQEVPLVLEAWRELIEETAWSPDDLAYAKLDAAGQIRHLFEGRDAVFNTFSDLLRRDGDLAFLQTYHERLSAVTLEQMTAQASHCAQGHILGVVGPATALAAMDRAGLTWERLEAP